MFGYVLHAAEYVFTEAAGERLRRMRQQRQAACHNL